MEKKISKIAVLPGDGIGTEVMQQAIKVLKKIKQLDKLSIKYEYGDVGGAAIDKHGVALPKKTIKLCKKSDAILFGSVGGPKWESLPIEKQPERAALLPLRKEFNLYANLRPVKIYKELLDTSPIKKEILKNNLDLIVIRELSSGIYFGKKKKKKKIAYDVMIYRKHEIERIAHTAFKIARKRKKKLVSIDKANVLSSMVLWRETVTEIAKQYPDISTSHLYVDNACMQIIKNPSQFDVILCPNMFGDIISDESSVLSSSLGMLASASIGIKDNFGLYEPIGGSAPDIAGNNIANPIAQILSLAMLLEHSLHHQKSAEKIRTAIEKLLKKGHRTIDIINNKKTKPLGTNEIGDLICTLL